jgi:hypothetical protein
VNLPGIDLYRRLPVQDATSQAMMKSLKSPSWMLTYRGQQLHLNSWLNYQLPSLAAQVKD